jgi:hypothetical protein
MTEDKKTESCDAVRLNGKEISRDELRRQQEVAANQRGADIKEVSKDDFKMRLKE